MLFSTVICGLAAKSVSGEGLFSSHHWFLEEIRTTMVYETGTLWKEHCHALLMSKYGLETQH